LQVDYIVDFTTFKCSYYSPGDLSFIQRMTTRYVKAMLTVSARVCDPDFCPAIGGDLDPRLGHGFCEFVQRQMGLSNANMTPMAQVKFIMLRLATYSDARKLDHACRTRLTVY